MLFFLDTADINEIQTLAETGLVDGITTNPSLVAKGHTSFSDLIKEICAIIPGPVSAEVISTSSKEMVEEGRILAKLASNVVIKVPLTSEGLKACQTLTNEGIRVNVTLCFTPIQALLAAKSGAYFISPFCGRLDDIGHDGMEVLSDIKDIYSHYPQYETKILAASIRNPQHVLQAALLGADAITIPPKIFHSLVKHPLTEQGLEAFIKDWEKSSLRIR